MEEALFFLWEIFVGAIPIFIILIIFFGLVCYGFQMLRLFFKF